MTARLQLAIEDDCVVLAFTFDLSEQAKEFHASVKEQMVDSKPGDTFKLDVQITERGLQ